MNRDALNASIGRIPAGRWAVAVSGGADSVALLSLLADRPGLALHVVHLDHQARGAESAGDAQFVRRLSDQLRLPCTVETRERLEPLHRSLPANPSARYRALRLALYGEVVRTQGLDGVMVAHHADDQAETIFQRLLRGSGFRGLAGMRRRQRIHGVTLLRPLLDVRARTLRQVLTEQGIAWREDASNRSPGYQRNRVRQLLREDEELTDALLRLGESCDRLRRWVDGNAPRLERRLDVDQLRDSPGILTERSARRWLRQRGCPPQEITPPVVERLLEMVNDAASPPRLDFPGRLRLRRQRGIVEAERI